MQTRKLNMANGGRGAHLQTRRVLPVVCCLTILHFVLCLQAQGGQLAVDFFAVGGVSGASTGGVFTVNATIGEPDTKLSSDAFTMDTGYSSPLAIVRAPEAVLHITRLGANAGISWSATLTGFVLQQNSDLNNPSGWANAGLTIVVTNGQNTVTAPINSFSRFYRLKK